MIKRIKKFLKVNKIAIVIALTIVIIGITLLILFVFNKNSSIKTIQENGYSFKYDNNWKIDKKTDNIVTMKHKSSDSLLKVEIVSLDSENKYSSIEELIDEILYNIENQNDSYKLLSKQEEVFTKYQFNGYKMLYETEKSQTMVSTFKKGDKLIIISYEAKSDCFDILLDSVHSIIYSLDIKEETYNLSKSISLKIGEIEYTEEKQIDKLLDKTRQYEIAYNNYYVSYSIPTNFIINNFNSTFNSFSFTGLENGYINIDVNIWKRNIYEYLDKDNLLNLYNNYKYYNGEDNKDYSGFKETISELSNHKESFIYKNRYYNDKAYTYDKDFQKKEYKRMYENIELIYALNENHILVIKISSSDFGIPKKLVDMIKVNETSNYSSYIKINNESGYLIGELKRFTDYNKTTYESIIIRIPEKYLEYDENTNIYEERYYGLNYSEENDMYDYTVKYSLSGLKDIDSIVKILGEYSYTASYGKYVNLSSTGQQTINDKSFEVFVGGYSNLGGIPFTNINRFTYYINKKVLIYKMETGGYLIIEISGNGKDITQEVINEVTNFTIEKKDYK